MQHFYSFCGSPLHLVLEDEIAEGYNRFIDAFQAGQKKFKEDNGYDWTPDKPFWMDYRPEDKVAYDKVGRVINLLVEINGGGLDITEEQCTSDHMIRV